MLNVLSLEHAAISVRACVVMLIKYARQLVLQLDLSSLEVRFWASCRTCFALGVLDLALASLLDIGEQLGIT